MESVLPLITAFGLGSLISVLVQIFFSGRAERARLIFTERKEAYIGLLEAWRDQEIEGVNQANRLSVGHWSLRAQLVASSQLKSEIERWVNSEPGSPEKNEATKTVKAYMRRDLLSGGRFS